MRENRVENRMEQMKYQENRFSDITPFNHGRKATGSGPIRGLSNNLKPRILPVSKSQTIKKTAIVMGNTLNCLEDKDRA